MGICKLETRGVSSPPPWPPSPSTLAVSAYSARIMYYCRRPKKKKVMCSRAESIFWFSTSALIEKRSGLSHSDPLYGSIPLRDGLNWNTTKLYSCRVVWLLCACGACVVMLCLQGTCSRPRLEQQEVSHIYVPLSGCCASPSLCYFLRTLVIICYTRCVCSVKDSRVMAFKLCLLVKNCINSTKPNMSTKSPVYILWIKWLEMSSVTFMRIVAHVRLCLLVLSIMSGMLKQIPGLQIWSAVQFNSQSHNKYWFKGIPHQTNILQIMITARKRKEEPWISLS